MRSPFGGRIPAIPGVIEAEDFDNGPEGVAYHDGTPENRGNRQGHRSTPVDLDLTLDGKITCVAFIQPNEWLTYTVEVAVNGTYDVEVSASGVGNARNQGFRGEFRIEFDGVDVTGPIEAPDTKAWDSFAIVKRSGVRLTQGIRTMRIHMGTRQGNFNVDSVKFTRTGRLPPGNP
ncbi:MAG: carbohydrate-binding protein [Opitutaceae bacterium]